MAAVASKIPLEQLSKLMLHVSYRKVSQADGVDNTDYDCFVYFGGLASSFLLKSTPLYDPSVDIAVLDPYRDEPVPNEIIHKELTTRLIAWRTGLVRAKWGEEVDKFVWEWLYDVPKV